MKVAQIFGNFLGYFEVCHFILKSYYGYFCGQYWKIWVNFDSSIWSGLGLNVFYNYDVFVERAPVFFHCVCWRAFARLIQCDEMVRLFFNIWPFAAM